MQTITLITTFQLGDGAVGDDGRRADRRSSTARSCPAASASRCPATRSRASTTGRSIRPYDTKRLAKSIGREVPLREAIGQVAAEEVEVYPPGIPLILEGFRVGADAVSTWSGARASGGSIVARDTSLADAARAVTRRVGRAAPRDVL